MKFWQAVSMVDIGELPAIAMAAEGLGYEGIILSDHLLTFARQQDRYKGSKSGEIIWQTDTHWPDAWVLIGALSQSTTSLKFLTAVYVLPLRDPFSAAKSVSTAAILSNDRVILGVGIGWQEAEFEAVGQDFHNRGRRVDEMLAIMKKLMIGERIDFKGNYYRFESLYMSPAPAMKIPIYVGGFSVPALRRAARNDGWIGAQHDVDDLRKIVEVLREERQLLGKSNQPFEIVACVKDPNLEKLCAVRGMGVSKVYRSPWLDKNGLAQKITLHEKLADMEEFSRRYFGLV